MAKQRFSGPKYANGNHKSQQKAYNKTPKGKALIENANRLRKQLKLPVGHPDDAGHYKNSTTKGRPQKRSKNRASRTK